MLLLFFFFLLLFLFPSPLGGRIRTIMSALPDIRIVSLVRHPYEAIPSMLSMFSIPIKTLNAFNGRINLENHI